MMFLLILYIVSYPVYRRFTNRYGKIFILPFKFLLKNSILFIQWDDSPAFFWLTTQGEPIFLYTPWYFYFGLKPGYFAFVLTPA